MENLMAEYIVRKGKFKHEVAKFEDSTYPIDVYSIGSRGCNCPARSRSCKHVKILKAWQKGDSEIGLVFNDNADIIGKLWMN
jgi:hypothetical protein